MVWNQGITKKRIPTESGHNFKQEKSQKAHIELFGNCVRIKELDILKQK